MEATGLKIRSESGRLKRKRDGRHPYLSGNFAPVQQTCDLTPCSYTGTLPSELAGGQYVRNGGNPVSNEDLGRDAHWFDGDGMLAGLSFRLDEATGEIRPEFVNKYILTDVYLSTLGSPSVRRPILPSIATLTNPAASLLMLCWHVLRTVLLVILSVLAGSRQAIKKISVANTALLYHDGRALATCESGPPMRVQLPGLETVGWYDGAEAEGEHHKPDTDPKEQVFGGEGLIGFMKEWTTGHPKVDPLTREMILYHGTFVSPYIHYSVLPEKQPLRIPTEPPAGTRLLNAPVPGISGAKMMHDFGASHTHTVIMDLPLSLDPTNLLRNKPVVCFDGKQPSRFGVFPRHSPQSVRWFETKAACIFHTANTWDTRDAHGGVAAVNMLACRLTSAALVFSAGNLDVSKAVSGHVRDAAKPISFFEKYDYDDALRNGKPWSAPEEEFQPEQTYDYAPGIESPPLPNETTPLLIQGASTPYLTSATSDALLLDPDIEVEQCRLYYYRFSLSRRYANRISAQYALSVLPFEFPSVHPLKQMHEARYVYGCSTSALTSFGTALGKAAKIDVLLKIDAQELIRRGERRPPRSVTGCVDTRSLHEVVMSGDARDPIKAFVMPGRWFAQEPRFVPRRSASAATEAGAEQQTEDDGYLLFYAFDESQLPRPDSVPLPSARSELWVVDAKTMGSPGVGMGAVVARVALPQRVPYGLHGAWFGAEEIQSQRGVREFRSEEAVLRGREKGAEERRGVLWDAWMGARGLVEQALG